MLKKERIFYSLREIETILEKKSNQNLNQKSKFEKINHQKRHKKENVMT